MTTEMFTTAGNAENTANEPAYMAHGRKAVVELLKGEKATLAGTAVGVYAVCQAWDGVEFDAYARDKEGALLGMWEGFSLSDYCDRTRLMPKSADGKDIRALQTEVSRVVWFNLFGVEEEHITPGLKTGLSRVFSLAADLMRVCDSSDIDLSARGFLKVPFQVVNKKPGPDASESAQEAYDNNADKQVTLDQKQGVQSLANLRRMVTPVAKREQPDAGETAKAAAIGLATSLTFVTGIVQSWTEEAAKNGTSIAPNTDLNRKAWLLKATLDRYFAENADVVATFNAPTGEIKAA